MLMLLVALAVVATPSIAQKVTIDYAHDFDFSQVNTFTYVDTNDTNSGSDLTDQRIKQKIIEKLTSGEDSLKKVDSGGDIYITYHVATKDNTVFNTSHFGYGGYGPGWGGWGGYGYYGGGMGSSTTTATTYTEGTLIIDAYEPGEKKMVWRGTGTVTLKAKPEKQYKQVDKILDKIDKRWDKIHTGQGK
jgi:type II secretory pathway component GspD/PulD (secretin)